MRCEACGAEADSAVCPLCRYLGWYMAQGFSFFPLRPGSKRPALPSWKPYQERRPSAEEVEDWRRRGLFGNVAVVTGRVSGNLAVLDFDNPSAYERVFRHELEEETFVVRTSRGVHVYVRSRNPPGPTERYPSLGFEYKAEGGYVVAPPSIHPSGAEYTVIGTMKLIEVEDMGEEKLRILERLGWKGPRIQAPAGPENSEKRRPLMYIPPCIQRLKGIPKGFRNEAAMRLAGFLIHELELPQPEAWRRLLWWNQYNRPPLPEEELRSVFRNALKGGYRYGCSSMGEYCVPGLCRISRPRALRSFRAAVAAVADGRVT